MLLSPPSLKLRGESIRTINILMRLYNSLEDILSELTKEINEDKTTIDNCLYISLDKDRRLVISAKETDKNNFEKLQLQVISKTSGKIFENEIDLTQVTTKIILPSGISEVKLHIEKDDFTNKYKLIGYNPDDDNLIKITNTIQKYINLWK